MYLKLITLYLAHLQCGLYVSRINLSWVSHVGIARFYLITTLIATLARIWDSYLDGIAIATNNQPYERKLRNSAILLVVHATLIAACLCTPRVTGSPVPAILASQILRLIYQTMYQIGVRRRSASLLTSGKLLLIGSDLLGSYAQYKSLAYIHGL